MICFYFPTFDTACFIRGSRNISVKGQDLFFCKDMHAEAGRLTREYGVIIRHVFTWQVELMEITIQKAK